MWDKFKRLLPRSKSKEELEEHYRRLEDVELEKSDLPAMIIAAVLTILLPLLLLIGAIYSLVYFLFVK